MKSYHKEQQINPILKLKIQQQYVFLLYWLSLNLRLQKEQHFDYVTSANHEGSLRKFFEMWFNGDCKLGDLIIIE